jgi:hypothetical protein
MRNLLALMLLAFTLTGCMNNYFDKFGGFPFESQSIVISEKEPNISLLVTYRYPYQEEKVDSTSLNMSVNVIISRQEMGWVSIDKLTVAAPDGSYLMTYNNPAVYEPNSRFPMRFDNTESAGGGTYSPSQEPSIFTVSQNTPEYIITLYYRVYNEGGISDSFVRSHTVNISDIKRKTHYL